MERTGEEPSKTLTWMYSMHTLQRQYIWGTQTLARGDSCRQKRQGTALRHAVVNHEQSSRAYSVALKHTP
jgi:hypothetical protein